MAAVHEHRVRDDAPAETTVPRPRMLRSTRAPASTTQPERTTEGPDDVALHVALALQEDTVAAVDHLGATIGRACR